MLEARAKPKILKMLRALQSRQTTRMSSLRTPRSTLRSSTVLPSRLPHQSFCAPSSWSTLGWLHTLGKLSARVSEWLRICATLLAMRAIYTKITTSVICLMACSRIQTLGKSGFAKTRRRTRCQRKKLLPRHSKRQQISP